MGEQYNEALPVGHHLLQYRVTRILGQGGFGITYLAHDVKLDQPVAVKEFFPGELAFREQGVTVRARSGDHGKKLDWCRDRFLQEARTLARFRHPNIVRVQNFFEANQTAYMVMEYEDGESLAARLKRKPPVSEGELVALTVALLDGLSALHAAGFIHRDIKPGNIYIRHDGSPVLLDFGSARQSMGEQTKTLTAFLTPGYAPFEQYYSKSDRQGPWTDIYAMGAVLYRAVSGEPPLHATDRSSTLLREGKDPMPSALAQGKGRYSESFLRAIDHALRVLEKDRPQDVNSWRQELLPSRQTMADPPPKPSPPPPRRGRRWLTILLILLLLAGGGKLLQRMKKARQEKAAQATQVTPQPPLPVSAAAEEVPAAPPEESPPALPVPEIPESSSPPEDAGNDEAGHDETHQADQAALAQATRRLQERLQKNPRDRRAQQELRRIGRAYLNMAHSAAQGGRLEEAKRLIDQASPLLPEDVVRRAHKRLSHFRNESR